MWNLDHGGCWTQRREATWWNKHAAHYMNTTLRSSVIKQACSTLHVVLQCVMLFHHWLKVYLESIPLRFAVFSFTKAFHMFLSMLTSRRGDIYELGIHTHYFCLNVDVIYSNLIDVYSKLQPWSSLTLIKWSIVYVLKSPASMITFPSAHDSSMIPVPNSGR